MTISRIGSGVYLVDADGRREIVYVAGSAGDRWVFWNGRVFRGAFEDTPSTRGPSRGTAREGSQSLSAPMPATVLKVLVQAGDAVKIGDTLVILEAMKMELPLRSTSAATVTAVYCREGQLVQPETVLVELT